MQNQTWVKMPMVVLRTVSLISFLDISMAFTFGVQLETTMFFYWEHFSTRVVTLAGKILSVPNPRLLFLLLGSVISAIILVELALINNNGFME